MKIIRCMNALPRLVSGSLADRLAVMPAVVVTVARQTGKSTLAERLVGGERRYRSLDDFDVLAAARRDPEALLGGNAPITLDEVQRAPTLLSAVKRAIDRNRTAGRFLLTGSANLLLMRQVSEDWHALARRGGFPTPAVELTRRARHLVRRLRAHLSRARPAGPGHGQFPAGFPPADAGGLPALGANPQPDRAGA
ncbi:MAG: hypothetical protein FJ083_10635 [Cyanobacteria bacterium K_Offshore_surface_m2_239]|nr:hypothetical protein [Cyanobacteria bacterium K_Offshore_surface_m2_239]